MLTRDDALRLCDTVLAATTSAGAEDAVVSVQSSIEAHARFADNRITTSGRSEDLEITATAWVGRRRGSVTGNDAGARALARLAADAVQIARVSPVHREYVPTLGPLEYADGRGFAPATADVDVKGRAGALDVVLGRCRDAGVTGAGFHSAGATAVAAATANGNRRYFQSSDAGLSLTARTADGTGSGYYAADHFDVARIDAAQVAAQAVEKAVRSRAPKPIAPGVYPVLLEPQAVADLLGFLTGSFDARTAEEGRSPFSAKDGTTRIGDTLLDERLSLYSDPMHAELPAVPATAEGVPASRLSLVRAGRLEQLVTTRFWAQERQVVPSAGPVNYILESAAPPASAAALLQGMSRGLLISRFWYVRLVDPRTLVLTGLTRDGLWWVEDGRISHPVRNLRFNQSVLAMLAPGNVEAIGAARRLAPLMVPALRLNAFAFTSVSDAI
jgi:predicted Zn-dependent protease